MGKVRFKYSKTGKSKYISHLDLRATMQRAFLRAGVNLKYSEGFNPHPYMSVALPLSVGIESLCELIDVGIADDRIPDISSIKFPDGISLLEAYIPERKFADITWIEINGNIHYEKGKNDDRINRLIKRFSEASIIISKRTKRGFKDLDIKPHIKDVHFIDGCIGTEKSIDLTAKISAQNPTLNTDDLINVLGDELKPDFADMKRVAIYDSNMILFR